MHNEALVTDKQMEFFPEPAVCGKLKKKTLI